MVEVKLTPLENEYPGNKHGIRSVLKRWKRSINNLDYYGLPEPCFSRVGHNPYYGYPDVWDTSQITDLTYTDGPDIKGLFEGENLQSLFIRQAKDFEVYYTEKEISRKLYKLKNKDDTVKVNGTTYTYDNPPSPSNWMSFFSDDVTHYNDGPVVNYDTGGGTTEAPAVWVKETRKNVEKWKSKKRRLPRVFFIHMWDLSNVRNARRLFKNCIFNMEICNWNFDNIECMEEMFAGTKFFCTPIKFLKSYELKNTFYDELSGTSPLGELHRGYRSEDKKIQLPNWQIHLIKEIWNPLKKSLYVNVKESDTHTYRDRYLNTVIRGWNLLSNNAGGSSAKVLVGFFLYQNEYYARTMSIKAVDGEKKKGDPGKYWTLQGMTYADEYTRKYVNHELHFKGFGNAVNPISPDGDANMKPKLTYTSYNQYSHIAQLINAIKKDVTEGRWGWTMTEEEIKYDPNLKILDSSSNTGIKNFVIELTKYHIGRIIKHRGWRTRANNYPEEFMSVFRTGKTFEPRTVLGKTIRKKSAFAQGSQTYGYPFTAASQSFYGTLNIDQFKYKWTTENAHEQKETGFLNGIEDRNGDVAKQIARYQKRSEETIPDHERGVYFINFQDIAKWYFKNVIKHPKSIFGTDPRSNYRRSNNSYYNRSSISNNNFVIASQGHLAGAIQFGYLAYLNTSDGVKNELDGCDWTHLKYIAGACSSLGVKNMPYYNSYKNKRSNTYNYLKRMHNLKCTPPPPVFTNTSGSGGVAQQAAEKLICAIFPTLAGCRKSINFVDFNENLEVRNLEVKNLEDEEDEIIEDEEDEIIEDEEDEIIEDEEDEIIEDEEDEIIEDEYLEDEYLEDENLEDELIEDKIIEDENLENENLEDENLEDENLEDKDLEDDKEKNAGKEIVLLNTRNNNNEDDKEKNIENEIILSNTRNAQEDKNARDVDNILSMFFGDPDDKDAEKVLGRDESAGPITAVFGVGGLASLSKTFNSNSRYYINKFGGSALKRGNRAGNFARRLTGFSQVQPTKMKAFSAKFARGAAIDFALWGLYEILENNNATPKQTIANAPPPPGNPFSLEDPRQLLNLENMSPMNVIRTLICVGGQYVAMAALGIVGNLILDLVCYVWDTIQWSIESIPYKYAVPPNVESFISIPMVQNSNHGHAFNHEPRKGDYIIAEYWNFQATHLYTNNENILKNMNFLGAFIYPIPRSRDLYNDDGTFNGTMGDGGPVGQSEDLDLRVKEGYMRKKGNWYIWLNNKEHMNNTGGQYTLYWRGNPGQNPDPLSTSYLDSHCSYNYLPTNISKCLSSWSIRKPYYVTVTKKTYESSRNFIDNFTSTITNIIKKHDPNFRKYSMTRIFENAITDMPLFDNTKYNATSIPIIQGVDDSPSKRNNLDRVRNAFNNASLFPDINVFKWDLSEFKYADYAFSGVQRLYRYGYFYNLWIDKGSSPANTISLPHIYEVRDQRNFPLLLDEPNLGNPPMFKLKERAGYVSKRDVDRYNSEREKIVRQSTYRWNRLYPYPDTPNDYSYKNIYHFQRDEVFEANWLDVQVKQLHPKYNLMGRYNNGQKWNDYGYKYPTTYIPNIKQFLNLDKDRKMFITLEGLHYIHTFLFHKFWTEIVMPDQIDNQVTNNVFLSRYGNNGRLGMSQGTLGDVLRNVHGVSDSNKATEIIKEIDKKPLETQVFVYRLVFELSCLKRNANQRYTGFAGHRKLWGKQWCVKAAYLATVEFFIGNYNNLLFRHSFNHNDVFNTLYGFTGNPVKISKKALDKAISLITVTDESKKDGPYKYINEFGAPIKNLTLEIFKLAQNKDEKKQQELKRYKFFIEDEIKVLKDIINMGLNDGELEFIAISANTFHHDDTISYNATEELKNFDVTKLRITSLFNPENFKNMESLTYMFRGNTFSYGFEDIHILMFNWNKIWKENPIIKIKKITKIENNAGQNVETEKEVEETQKRDLRYMFSDTDFIDTVNNNLSSLEVKYLEVDQLFGTFDYDTDTKWRKKYQDNHKHLPDEWKIVDQNDEINRIYGKNNRPGYTFASYLVSDDYENTNREINIDQNLTRQIEGNTSKYSEMFSDTKEQIKYLYFNLPKSIEVNDDVFGALIEKMKYLRQLDTNLLKHWNKWVKKRAPSGENYWINPFYKLDTDGNNPTWSNPNKLIPDSKNFEENIKYLNTEYIFFWQEVFKDFKNFNLDISRWDLTSIMLWLPDTYKNMFENTQVTDLKILKIIFDKLITMRANNVALKYFGLDKLDTSLITDMSSLFEHGRITSIKDINGNYVSLDSRDFDLDISAWDVSNVTNMENMFKGCSSFNQDLSDWDLSNVVTTKGMFEDCTSFNQDISNLDTSKVINMENMFKGTTNLDKDIRNLSVESLIRYNNIFLDATKINEKYKITLDFNGYDNDENFVKHENYGIIHYYLTDIEEEEEEDTKRKNEIINYIKEKTSVYALNINQVIKFIADNEIGLEISMEQIENLFSQTDENDGDIHREEVAEFIFNIERIDNMSKYERILNKSLVSKNIVEENTIIESIKSRDDVKNDVFRTKYNFFKYKFNNKDELIYAINYYKLYGKVYKLVYGNMGNWNVSKISDLSYLFYEINGDYMFKKKGLLFNEDISEWDVSHVVNMRSMFYKCFDFNQDIGKWNVSNVTNMEEMFWYATIFNQDISTKEVKVDDGTTYTAWDVTNVINMKKMFRGAYRFDYDIRKWNVRNADIYYMFRETRDFLDKYFKITEGRFENTGLYTKYDIDYTQNKHKYFIFNNTINPEELRNMTDKYVDLFYD